MNYHKYFRQKVSLPLLMLLMAFASMLLAPASSVVQAQGPSLPPPPPIKPDPRFGIVQAYDDPQLARAAGVGWTRALLEWDQLQQLHDYDWNPHYFHHVTQWKEGLGRDVPMAGLLIKTPEWASNRQNIDENGNWSQVPAGIDQLQPYDEESGNLWGRFVLKAIQEYRDDINEWIIWNEPDICHGYHRSWTGNVEEYIKLLKIAYLAKEEVDPDAKMVMAATTYWNDMHESCPKDDSGELYYISSMLETINQDPQAEKNNGFFDAVGINLYLDPDQMYKIIKAYRRTLNEYGFSDKQIWLTETNVQHLADPDAGRKVPDYYGEPAYSVTLQEQGHFLVQAWSMAMAAGVERIQYYKTRDRETDGDEGKPYGLQRIDGTLRPVFWSYRTIVTYLGGYTNARLTEELSDNVNLREPGIRQVVVDRGALGTTTVVWNRNEAEQDVSIPAEANSALLVDSFGPIGTINAVDGQYLLRLPPRVEEDDRAGGGPYMIVEGPGADLCIARPPGNQDGIPPINNNVSPYGLEPLPFECELVASSPEVTPEASASPEVTPEASASPEVTPEASASPEVTPEASASPEVTPSVSVSPEITPSVSASPEITPSVSASPEITPSVSASPEVTPEVSASPEITPEASASPEVTPEASASPEITPEASASPEVTPEASASPTPSTADWAIPNGHFFTQTGNGQGGFSVVDNEEARFWSEYRRLGGVRVIGYPISRRYKYNGFITQAFEHLILQWQPEVGQASPINLFDDLSQAGFDQQLLEKWQIPLPLRSEEFDSPNDLWNETVVKRQALLDENLAIKAAYFAESDPLAVFGVPTSRLQDMGNSYAIRTQRTVFYQWKEDVSSAAQGEVSFISGGLVAQELGWLPFDSLQPEQLNKN